MRDLKFFEWGAIALALAIVVGGFFGYQRIRRDMGIHNEIPVVQQSAPSVPVEQTPRPH